MESLTPNLLQGSIHPNYAETYVEGLGYLPSFIPQEGPPLTSSSDTPAVFAAPLGQPYVDYGVAPVNGAWIAPVDATNAGYGPVWPISPMNAVPHNPWPPTDGQPLPSPISEAPPYALTMSPFGMDRLNGYPNQCSQSGTNSPATTTNSTLPTPLPQPGDNPTTKKAPHPQPKRPAESAPRPPRPRTLKRHRSDTPSIASITSISTTGSASTVGSATTTLGGVLPANVDPRVASEQICREVRERSKAEALEMRQRRMMLLDHEQGALERETQRLQVNLSLMREAAKREQAGLEEEEARAGRAEKWVGGG